MTRERFLSLRFKPYMELWYINQRKIQFEEYLPVMLLAIDYDNDVFKVIPFPNDPMAHEVEFWCSRDWIELPKNKMKLVKK